MKSRHRVLASALVLSLLPASALAFKPDTHVYVAQRVLEDARDGWVTIEPFGDFAVDPAALEAIQRFPEAYRMGAIGPDGFPDLIGGQLTTHPGDGGWGTDEWLAWILASAHTPEERAFAYGYVTHAASDVFSHTYVNGWSGEIFVLEGGAAEEARHVALEDFIRLHTPVPVGSGGPIRAWDALDLPADFVSRALIRSPAVADRYRATGLSYLSSMYDEWAAVNGAITKAEAVRDQVNGKLQAAQNAIADASGQLDSAISWLNSREICTPRICVKYVGCTPQWCESLPNYPDICWASFVDPTGAIITTCATIATLQGTLATAEASLEPLEWLATLITGTTLAPLYDWRYGLELAMREYVRASRLTSIAIMQHGDPVAPMRDWLACWGPVFAGVPASVAVVGCAAVNFASKVTEGISGIQDAIQHLPPPLNFFIDPIGTVKKEIDEHVMPAATLAALDLGQALAPGSGLFKFAEALMIEYDAAALNAEYAHDISGKFLLEIPDIAERVSAEMQLDNGVFSELYPVVRNAITLSKLALLPAEELNRMVAERGIPWTAYGANLFAATSPFNILLSSVLSIDGSHQWQEHALPYPRRVGVDSETRSYGRAFDGSNGFRLWHDCAVRKLVFLSIFDGPLAAGLEQPAPPFGPLLPSDSPFAGSTSNKFPLAPGSVLQDVLPPVPDTASLSPVTGDCPFTITSGPTATDLCSTGPIPGIPARPTTFSAAGTYDVEWVFTDSAGNSARQHQSITVVDTTPPVLSSIPFPVTVEQENRDGTRVVLPAARAVDACSGSVELVDDAPAIFPLGATVVHYAATDGAGNVARASTTVTVVDTRAPSLTNVPAPVTVEQATYAGTAVSLPLPAASDVCDAAPVVASNAPAVFPLGANVVTFTATDASGNIGRATTVVTVQDTTPPRIEALDVSPPKMWAPNHAMVLVTVRPTVRDTCDVAPACAITAVRSNEAALANGSGKTQPDWEIVGNLAVLLRAERTGAGTGRVYDLTVRCTDASGNSATAVTRAMVAHDAS